MKAISSCLLSLCLALSACNGGRSEPSPEGLRSNASITSTSSAQAALPVLDAPCDWVETFRIDDQYYALSDTGARYFLAMLPAGELANAPILIDGQAPDARYFSLHSYDGYTHRIDSLADHEILKASLLQIPLLKPDKPADYAVRAGERYQLTAVSSAAPEQRQVNHIYTGTLVGEDALLARRFLMYRIYQAEGSVSLPQLSIQTAQGSLPFSQVEDSAACAAHHQQQQIAFTETPDSELDPANSSGIFRRFVGLNDGSEGSFVNDHIEYLFSRPQRIPGRVYWVRAQAPRWMKNSFLGLGKVDVRFWSLCQNPRTAMPVAGCINDHEARIDNDGYFNVLISSEADKPNSLLATQSVDWLPWGVQDAGLTVYRQMLSSPRYDASISNAKPGFEIFSMGQHYPRARSCSRSMLEQSTSTDLESVFLNCESFL